MAPAPRPRATATRGRPAPGAWKALRAGPQGEEARPVKRRDKVSPYRQLSFQLPPASGAWAPSRPRMFLSCRPARPRGHPGARERPEAQPRGRASEPGPPGSRAAGAPVPAGPQAPALPSGNPEKRFQSRRTGGLGRGRIPARLEPPGSLAAGPRKRFHAAQLGTAPGVIGLPDSGGGTESARRPRRCAAAESLAPLPEFSPRSHTEDV